MAKEVLMFSSNMNRERVVCVLEHGYQPFPPAKSKCFIILTEVCFTLIATEMTFAKNLLELSMRQKVIIQEHFTKYFIQKIDSLGYLMFFPTKKP